MSDKKRGNYMKCSLLTKKKILKEIKMTPKPDYEDISLRYNLSVRRIKAIEAKQGDLRNSGRSSFNEKENKILYEEGFGFFVRHRVRPSPVYLSEKKFNRNIFKSNGQKENFTKNLIKYIQERVSEEDAIYLGLKALSVSQCCFKENISSKINKKYIKVTGKYAQRAKLLKNNIEKNNDGKGIEEALSLNDKMNIEQVFLETSSEKSDDGKNL